jgi:lipoprotein-anchoring transpeptidase ErfK/SrfK
MMYRIRLGLCVCVLAMGAIFFALAQEQIATAADLMQSSGEFDAASLLTFDPAATLRGEDLFGADDPDSAQFDALANYADSMNGPEDLLDVPQDAQAAPADLPGQQPSDLPADAAGWPRTTAQTTLAGTVVRPPSNGKWIDVNLSRQVVTAYLGSVPVRSVLTSTGTRRHPTVVGTFRVWAKVRSQTMRGGSRAAGDYYSLPGVPNIMYFYRGFALHGTYWHRNFGHVMSHGCVNLTLNDSAWFYNWSPAGITVRTHY